MNLTEVYPELAQDQEYTRWGRFQNYEQSHAAYLLRRYPTVKNPEKVVKAAKLMAYREVFTGRTSLTDLLVKNIMHNREADDSSVCCTCD